MIYFSKQNIAVNKETILIQPKSYNFHTVVKMQITCCQEGFSTNRTSSRGKERTRNSPPWLPR
jgi:hypothetical protein